MAVAPGLRAAACAIRLETVSFMPGTGNVDVYKHKHGRPCQVFNTARALPSSRRTPAGAVHAFGGEVLKFIGDGVLAIIPVTGAPAAACGAALRAVVAARAGMAHLDTVRQAQGLPRLPFGAALHLGEILWGNIGAADRLDFTAIGPAVNLVSRLEGLCRPLGRSVLISGAVAAETATPLRSLGQHELRGIAAPCDVFTLPE